MVREPGTTPLGQHLRDYLKSSQPLSSKAELLLFAAARAELVGTTIKPNLDAGISIIADRFEASSMAYQGFGRKLSKKIINTLNNYVTNEIHPDLTILLDLQTDEEMKRIGLQLPLSMALGGEQTVGRIDKENQRRFEDLPTNFHKRVRSGFLDLAEKSQDSWVVLDARLTIDELAEQVWNAVSLCFDKVNAKLAKINVS